MMMMCRRSGHRARQCSSASPPSSSLVCSPSPSNLPVAPPASSTSCGSAAPGQPTSAPLLLGNEMPRVGDPSLRPSEGHVVITSTPAMDAQAASLANLAAVAWLGGNRPSVSASVIRDAVATSAGIDRAYVKVVPFYPEDFLVRFDYQHHRDLATAGPGRFSHYSSDFGNLDIHIAKWRLNAHAEVVQADFHVHICLENVPLNAWNDAVAAQVLGPDTFLHYFDIASVQCEDAATLNLWAWSADPSKIPKVLQATFTNNQPPGSSAPNPAVGRQGLKRSVLVHLDLIEDYTPGADGKVPRRPRTHPPFTWRLGVVDGESRARDRQDEGNRRERRNDDRDRDDEHDGRGRRNDRQESSWRGLFQSRSRAPRRDDDRSRGPREDRHHDDHDSRGRYDSGRRRGLEPLSPNARKVDNARVQRLPDGAVIPASGRRARHRAACPERRSRSCEVATVQRSEDNRGRSPPPSPRTTSSDIIELRPSSLIPDWLRRAAPCLGSPVTPEAPPGWASPVRQRHRAGSLPPSPSTPLHVPALTGCTVENQIEMGPVPAVSLVQGEAAGTPLFVPLPPAILPAPNSTPPRPPTTRRKTLAGVTGLNLIRSSPRLQAKNREMPIAQLAERLLCQRMGVVEEGEMITEAAINKYVALFRGQLPDIAIAALRALFRLDCDLAAAVEDALLDHGGDAGLEPQDHGPAEATASASA
ncbi:hypothetical protein VPH35_046901 [Triticum aestivum]